MFATSDQLLSGDFKAMNETFIPLDLATFETMPKFLPGEITIYNVGSFRDVSNKTDVKLAKQFVTDVQQVNYFFSFDPLVMRITLLVGETAIPNMSRFTLAITFRRFPSVLTCCKTPLSVQAIHNELSDIVDK
jgi:hypothetical protein